MAEEQDDRQEEQEIWREGQEDWPEEQDEWRTPAQACHQLLQQLAGRAPDDLLTQCRDWLAGDKLSDLAHTVTFWAVSTDAALAENDVILLSGLLADADEDYSGITQIRIDDFDPFPYYAFAQQIPPEFGGNTQNESALPPGAQADRPVADAAVLDRAAVQAAEAEPGAIGLWRAWRFPSDGAPWPRPKRVFMVEVPATVDEPGVAGRIQERLVIAGETSPQVEVYHTGADLPAYQNFARSYGDLVWAATEDRGIQLAAVFDEADSETGPSFRPDHPNLPDDEVDKVVQYLYSGEPLLVTTGRMDDVVDSSLVYSVPMNFRTDGTWIWTEASAYYAERHGLEPDAGLLAHIRSNDYTVPEVDGVAVYRALQVLQEPEPGSEPADGPALGQVSGDA